MNNLTIIRIIKTWFTRKFRHAQHIEALRAKVSGDLTASDELNQQVLVAIQQQRLGVTQPKPILSYPTWMDGLQSQDISSVELFTGERYEFRARTSTWALVRSKKAEPTKTRKAKTITPKTQRVMNPHTGEYEDVAI